MLGGQLYRPDDPQLIAELRRCQVLLQEFNALPGGGNPERIRILRQILGTLGEGTEVRAPFHCDYGRNIHIGARTFINYGAIILDCANVTIGDNVQMGPGIQLLTATHPLDAAARRSGVESALPISIGDDAWLGGGVIVCPGITIGPEAVIGAGSVVIRDVPARVVAVGNPCRVLRQL